MYPNTLLHIGGRWTAALDGRTLDVINPATGEVVGPRGQARGPGREVGGAAGGTGGAWTPRPSCPGRGWRTSPPL